MKTTSNDQVEIRIQERLGGHRFEVFYQGAEGSSSRYPERKGFKKRKRQSR